MAHTHSYDFITLPRDSEALKNSKMSLQAISMVKMNAKSTQDLIAPNIKSLSIDIHWAFNILISSEQGKYFDFILQ